MGRKCGTTLNMKTRHSEEQIIQALKEHQAGTAVAELCRSSKRQRGAGRVLAGDVQLHVARAEGLQAIGHDALREFGFVAIAAQVAEVEMSQVAGHDFRDAIRGGFVGEMAVPAEDALLQTPRAMRTILQHLHVVIGFEHERVGFADALQHELCDVAKVGGEPDAAAIGAQDEADRVLRVVRNGKRFHADVAHFKPTARDEQPEIQFCAFGDADDFVHGSAIAIDREARLLGNGREAGDMVAVFVRDENGGEVFRHAPEGGEALADLSPAEAHVDEQPRFVRFDVRSVAGGAAAEDREFHCHGETLKPVMPGSNANLPGNC